MKLTIAERCKATDGRETAASIENDIRSKLDPVALDASLKAFRSFAASWEGSIIVAIGTYLESIAGRSILDGGREP